MLDTVFLSGGWVSMFKKLLPFIATGLLSSPFQANADLATYYDYDGSCAYDGFFMGVSGGVANTYGKLAGGARAEFVDAIRGLDNTLTLDDNSRVSTNQATGGFTLGYSSVLCDWLYLGGELGAFYVPGHLSDSFDSNTQMKFEGEGTFDASLRMNVRSSLRKWEWTADFTPGVVVCDTFLLYGRIGYAANRAQFTADTEFHYFDTERNHARFFSPLTGHKKKGGVRVGGGISHYICENVSLNANYVLTFYGKVEDFDPRAKLKAIQGFELDNFSNNATAWLKRQSFLLGLNYYFGSMF